MEDLPTKDDIYIPAMGDTEALEVFRATAFLHIPAKAPKYK